MRITREEAAENKARIIAVAASRFREKGFDGIGLADLLREAGLTHGAFYNHFTSKDELDDAACRLAFETAAAKLTALTAHSGADRHRALTDYVARYLSREARDAPVICPIVSLSGEAARRGKSLRRHFAEGVGRHLRLLAAAIRGREADAAQAHEKAVGALALLVGGLLLARSVKDADAPLSDEILAITRKAVRDHIGD
ncbi:MAG TPA: TetR/AcrR family transcriptional regulator [Stellaceae bacterium]|nr:TetR/AcrR family transcriptional regulator [Stellaceae bacterium]